MAITTFMSLDLPTVSVTLGPDWASDLNDALTLIDSHDHTSGKGKKIVPAAMNINAALTFNAYAATDVSYLGLEDNNSTLSGNDKVYAVLGDLYWNNGSGVPVQITSGGGVVSVPASIETMDYTTTAIDISIGGGSPTVFVDVDTSVSSRTITLPAVGAVDTGRIYVIKDMTGDSETNALIVAASGGEMIDGQATVTLESNYGAWMFISNGVNGYSIF